DSRQYAAARSETDGDQPLGVWPSAAERGRVSVCSQRPDHVDFVARPVPLANGRNCRACGPHPIRDEHSGADDRIFGISASVFHLLLLPAAAHCFEPHLEHVARAAWPSHSCSGAARAVRRGSGRISAGLASFWSSRSAGTSMRPQNLPILPKFIPILSNSLAVGHFGRCPEVSRCEPQGGELTHSLS